MFDLAASHREPTVELSLSQTIFDMRRESLKFFTRKANIRTPIHSWEQASNDTPWRLPSALPGHGAEKKVIPKVSRQHTGATGQQACSGLPPSHQQNPTNPSCRAGPRKLPQALALTRWPNFKQLTVWRPVLGLQVRPFLCKVARTLWSAHSGLKVAVRLFPQAFGESRPGWGLPGSQPSQPSGLTALMDPLPPQPGLTVDLTPACAFLSPGTLVSILPTSFSTAPVILLNGSGKVSELTIRALVQP